MNKPYLTPALMLLIGLFSGCQHFTKTDDDKTIGQVIAFEDLDGWAQDEHSDALFSMLKSCQKLAKKPTWQNVCKAANATQKNNNTAARNYFEENFTAHALIGKKGKTTGMITGYYEPLLHGALQKSPRYQFPLYQSPEDMLKIDLSSLYPALKGKRVRGRLIGNKVIPYFSRAEIDGKTKPLKGQELLWVDDRDQLFFLQIQGSGRIMLPDGKIIGVGYANQNGYAYVSIGKKLVEMGELTLEEVNLFSIKDWLKTHPDQAQALLEMNPSYVFFALRDNPSTGPTGSLNVPLTPERSLAIDPKYVALGSPIWVSTTYPNAENTPFNKLLMAQDTGGAIKGQVRADIFWGNGEQAEKMAGNMKQIGQLFILIPKK